MYRFLHDIYTIQKPLGIAFLSNQKLKENALSAYMAKEVFWGIYWLLNLTVLNYIRWRETQVFGIMARESY